MVTDNELEIKFGEPLQQMVDLALDSGDVRQLGNDFVFIFAGGVPPFRLLNEIGAHAGKLGDRLRGPVGRQIGGRGPAAIALEIAAELQEHFSQ